jgi:creatinine amidohydrolase
MDHRLEALTSLDVKERMESGTHIAVLPVGAVEQHGPHGPLGTDGFIAREIAQGVAARLDALCLPPIWFGISPHHMHFAGSLTVTPRVFSAYLEDILESLVAQNFDTILALNGHGGNTGAISNALVATRSRHPNLFLAQSSVWLALMDVYESLPPEVKQDSWRTMISHGGLFETSVVMAVEEGAVRLDRTQEVSNAGFVQASDPVMTFTANVEELSSLGFGGDPRNASAELGRHFIKLSVDAIVSKYESARRLFDREDP